MSTGIEGFRPGEHPCEDCGTPTRQRQGALWLCGPHLAAYRRGVRVEVVAPERPQEPPKAVQAAPTLPVLPPRPLVAQERFRLATVAAPPKAGGSQPQRRPPLEVDPRAPLWRCQFRGCEREREWRGACGRCGRLALHRGQADLLLPPRQRRYPPGEWARLAAAIVGYMQQHGPGGRASDIGKALGIPSLLFWSVMRMLRLSRRVIRDHRGAYRLPDAPPRLPVTIRGRFELLLRRGPVSTEAAVEAIPAAPQQVARLTDRLQRHGVVRKVGVGGPWMLAG